MAFKLSTADSKLKDNHARLLRAAQEKITVQENVMTAAVDALNEAITAYNGTLADVESFVTEHRDAWQAEHDDKSDKWREGEKGEAASTFISEWDSIDLAEVDEVEAPEAPAVSHADDLDALPSESEG
jgi:hypothetical protein